MVVKRFEIYFVGPDPSVGSEMKKARPCIILSPDDMNRVLNTVIVAPLTATIRNYPSRVSCFVANKKGQIALDQLKTIDKICLKKKIGMINGHTQKLVTEILLEIFR